MSFNGPPVNQAGIHARIDPSVYELAGYAPGGIPPYPQETVAYHELASNFPIPQPPSGSFNNSMDTPRTLWMGDLDPWASEETVSLIWRRLGKNVLVKLIRVKRSGSEGTVAPHSGYCFVEFESCDDAQSALSLNGSPIPVDGAAGDSGKLFRLNWAAGATLASPISQSPEFSLFVGDLSPQTTEAHLLALFQTKFLSIKTVRVMTDPVTGASRCFGFVRFTSELERSQAVAEMQGAWLSGRSLRVAYATPRNMVLAGPGSDPTGGHPFQHGFEAFQPFSPVYHPAVLHLGLPPGMHPGMPVAPPPVPSFTDPANTTVFVGGLAAGTLELTLLQLFQPFGHIHHVKIPVGKGCGFVRFSLREEAERAIAGMQGFTISGSRIRLSWGRSQIAGAPPHHAVPPYPLFIRPDGHSPAFDPRMMVPHHHPMDPRGSFPMVHGFPHHEPYAGVTDMALLNHGMQHLAVDSPVAHSDPHLPKPAKLGTTPRPLELSEGTGVTSGSLELGDGSGEGTKLQEMYQAASKGQLDGV